MSATLENVFVKKLVFRQVNIERISLSKELESP